MFTLEDRIKSALEHCKNKRFGRNDVQAFLGDAFYRFIYDHHADKLPQIDCIKQFYFSDELQKRFDELINKFNVPILDENNKLLLIKCVVVEALLKEKVDN